MEYSAQIIDEDDIWNSEVSTDYSTENDDINDAEDRIDNYTENATNTVTSDSSDNSTHSNEIVEETSTALADEDTIELLIRYTLLQMINYIPTPRGYDASVCHDLVICFIRKDVTFSYTVCNDDSIFKIAFIEETPVALYITMRSDNNITIPLNMIVDIIVQYTVLLYAYRFNERITFSSLLYAVYDQIQERIEMEVADSSERTFIDTTYKKDDISEKDISSKLFDCIAETRDYMTKVDECELCCSSDASIYYECRECHYTFCDGCCKEIISRNCQCPCCSKPLSLIKYIDNA